MSVLETVRVLCNKYEAQEPPNLPGAQAIIEEGIKSISRVVELTDQLTDTQETYPPHEKVEKAKCARLRDLASQRLLLHGRRTTY